MAKTQQDPTPPHDSNDTNTQDTDDTYTQEDFERFLRVILSTPEIEKVAVGIKETHPDKRGVLTTNGRTHFGELLKDLLHPALKELTDTSKSTSIKVDSLISHARRTAGAKLDAASQTEGPLKERFVGVFPDEKRAISQRLSKTHLSNETRCFLQASTTILHLAEELRNNALGINSLYYTNSTIFPYLMLGREPNYKIYTLNGKHHDQLCCGWLYGSDDAEAEAYLIKLFNRATDQLTLAVITPQYMTPDGKLMFARPETKNLVQTLCDQSNHLVILSPGQRLLCGEEKAPSDNVLWHSAKIRDADARNNGDAQQTVDLIVSGPTTELENGISDMTNLVSQRKGTLHYQEQAPGRSEKQPITANDWQKLL